MNATELLDEEPLKNGIKNIELRDVSTFGLKHDPSKDDCDSLDSDKSFPEKPLVAMEISSVSSTSSTQHVMMKKRVGLLSGVALIVGTMIGKPALPNSL